MKKSVDLLMFLGAFLLLVNTAFGQKNPLKDDLVQVSGLIMTSDSLVGIPYGTVMIKSQGRGTVSNYQGFFSLVAKRGDVLIFSVVGFDKQEYTLPDTLTRDKYSIIQLMTADTVYLPETVIYPWPSKEQFKSAFLSLDIPDDDLERARKNLDRERLREIGEVMAMDANESADYYMRYEAQKFYYAGQAPPMNIFNPFAWAEFIKAWKNGDFKRKDKKR